MMRTHFITGGFILITLFISCKNSTKYQGDSMLNYPDMNQIAKDYLLQYEQLPYTFLKVTTEKDKKDSAYVNAEQVNWKEIHSLFAKANLYDSVLDKQYKITVISDTLTPVMTVLYTSINPKNLTRKLSINAENTDNKILSIYWETSDEGFFSSDEKKILYVIGKTIQIQEYSKKAFSGAKKRITQYVFLN